jgi:ribonucleotide monophosphatase NagD (HAD superfamily)
VEPDIGAVVVGWDPLFSYSRLVYASVCLREIPGCILVATNLDSADNIGNGRMMPGTGGLVAAVEVASGKTAVGGGSWRLRARTAWPPRASGPGCRWLQKQKQRAAVLAASYRPPAAAQVNVGKGGAWLLPFLCAQYGLQPQEALIVGDRLDTDIALGVQGGLRTVLPLTGDDELAAAGVPGCRRREG